MSERDKPDPKLRGTFLGSFEGVNDIIASPSNEALKTLAREGHEAEERKKRKRPRVRRASPATTKYHFSPLGLHEAAERARQERRKRGGSTE